MTDDTLLDYNVEDLMEFVRLMHENRSEEALEKLEKAPYSLLQALVDVSDNMMGIARYEAERRGTSLFTPWRTFIVAPKDKLT